ncbi:conserved hypothetical protein [Stutzerimonas stutzeri DSM 4166]|nr:conserved hypothetical protein [Stutzerimonas stutzeri DSM 4166]
MFFRVHVNTSCAPTDNTFNRWMDVFCTESRQTCRHLSSIRTGRP